MIKTSDLLIAPPQIPDQRFHEAVILLLNNNPDTGSLGLCLNKTTDTTIDDLDLGFEGDVSMPWPVYWGGPVNQRTLWMLHSTEWSVDDTVELTDKWSMTSSLDMFEALADGFIPEHFRMFAGYCSWAPQQLERELAGQLPWKREHAWLVAQGVTPEWLFQVPLEDLWGTATTLSSHQAVASWL